MNWSLLCVLSASIMPVLASIHDTHGPRIPTLYSVSGGHVGLCRSIDRRAAVVNGERTGARKSFKCITCKAIIY